LDFDILHIRESGVCAPLNSFPSFGFYLTISIDKKGVKLVSYTRRQKNASTLCPQRHKQKSVKNEPIRDWERAFSSIFPHTFDTRSTQATTLMVGATKLLRMTVAVAVAIEEASK
jgi:hypothetical protein